MAEENKEYNLEEILCEVQTDDTDGADFQETETSDSVIPKRPVFELHLDLDSEYGEIPEPTQVISVKAVTNDAPVRIPDEEEQPVSVHTPKKPKQTEEIAGLGCLKGLIYATVVLLLSGLLAWVVLVAAFDFTGISRDGTIIDITVSETATTEEVAAQLRSFGLIDQETIFRLYIKFAGADNGWRAGDFTLRRDMGYRDLLKSLQSNSQRETVKVTFPEGFTTKQIAERLEKNGVCTADEFYRALEEGDYSNYDFIAELSAVSKKDYEARFYKLEGYLFPDTYEFYKGCSGETVVRKMLDNFDSRLGTSVRTAMKTKGLTMDELITLASIIQGEVASKKDMQRVSRVLWNRLENTAKFPYLECDSTGDYVEKLFGSTTVSSEAYDTYKRKGLPAGAINNPGLTAIMAVLTPSEETNIQKCYFFATDYSDGKTYYSKTLAEHERVCKQHGIGMYG